MPCGWDDPDDEEPGNDFWRDPNVPSGSGLSTDRTFTFWSLTQPPGQKGDDRDWFRWEVERDGIHWLWTENLDPSSLHIRLLVCQAIGDSLIFIDQGESYEAGQLEVELEQGQDYYVRVSNLTPSKVGCYDLWLEP